MPPTPSVFERCFLAHGRGYGLRAQDGELLGRLAGRVPLGWHVSSVSSPDVSAWYVMSGADATGLYRLSVGGDVVIDSASLPVVLDAFERHAELLAAEGASDSLFVHAGVVAWHDRAIVMPGASGSGKTTLVRAFLAAGATYLSDEYARLDRDGFVHPYARALSLRGPDGSRLSVSPEDLGARTGTTPMPVGVIILTAYERDATWTPRRLSPANGLVRLMQHTVAARGDPAHSMPILKAVATRAVALESLRSGADIVVRSAMSNAARDRF